MSEENLPEKYRRLARQMAEEIVQQRGDVLAIFTSGSIARGFVGKGSDIDFFIILDTDLPYWDRKFCIREGIDITQYFWGKSSLQELNNPLFWDMHILYDPKGKLKRVASNVGKVRHSREAYEQRSGWYTDGARQLLDYARKAFEAGDYRMAVYYSRYCMDELAKIVFYGNKQIPPGHRTFLNKIKQLEEAPPKFVESFFKVHRFERLNQEEIEKIVEHAKEAVRKVAEITGFGEEWRKLEF